MAQNPTTRAQRAQGLVDAGAVTLHFDGTATVKGSGQAVYTVTRDSCTCPDFQKVAPALGDLAFMCKHRLATQTVCALYKACRYEARRTGRTRLPAALSRALRPVAA